MQQASDCCSQYPDVFTIACRCRTHTTLPALLSCSWAVRPVAGTLTQQSSLPACCAENAAIEDDFRPWRHGYTRADVWKAIEKEKMRNVLAVWEVGPGDHRSSCCL